MVMQSTKIKLSEIPGKFLWDTEATKHFEITLQSNWFQEKFHNSQKVLINIQWMNQLRK